jgi:hypothetical protein
MKTKICGAIGMMLIMMMVILSYGSANDPAVGDSESVLASPCVVCSLYAIPDSAECEYDKALNCAGQSLKWNDQTHLIAYREKNIPGNFYVNFLQRHYRGYCVSGECFGVFHTNISYVTRQVFVTEKRH